MTFRRLLPLLLLPGCAAPRGGETAAPPPPRRGIPVPALLPGVRVGDAALDARALAAEAAFLFPDQARAMIGSLLRSELARREARRLGLEADHGTLARSVEEAVAGIRASLVAGESLDDWARERFGRSWDEVRTVLEGHLADNQLYQLAVRAEARRHPRYRVHLLVSRDRQQAEEWARKLRAGADPAVLARESLEPGPKGDGRLPPLPPYLPPPLGEALAEAPVGSVVGPFRFLGDERWRVVRLAERLPPAAPAPVPVLLAGLEEDPLSPLEGRAWFQEMLRRYNAVQGLPDIQGPAIRFVRTDSPR